MLDSLHPAKIYSSTVLTFQPPTRSSAMSDTAPFTSMSSPPAVNDVSVARAVSTGRSFGAFMRFVSSCSAMSLVSLYYYRH